MARYTKSGSISTVQQIDAELEKIEVAQAELLSRTGDTPNQMEDTLDMNSQRLINLPAPLSSNEPLRLSDGLLLSGTREGGSTISEEPPVLKAAGDRWTRCSDMKAFLWYEDGDSGQWIEDRPSYGIDTIQNLSVPYVFDTVADMASSAISFPVGKRLETKNYSSNYEGGGAKWDVVLASSVVVDGYSVVLCTGFPTLAFVLRDKSDVLAYGLTLDGSTDDSAALQSMIDNGITPIFPSNRSIRLSALSISGDVILDFNNCSISTSDDLNNLSQDIFTLESDCTSFKMSRVKSSSCRATVILNSSFAGSIDIQDAEITQQASLIAGNGLDQDAGTLLIQRIKAKTVEQTVNLKDFGFSKVNISEVNSDDCTYRKISNRGTASNIFGKYFLGGVMVQMDSVSSGKTVNLTNVHTSNVARSDIDPYTLEAIAVTDRECHSAAASLDGEDTTVIIRGCSSYKFTAVGQDLEPILARADNAIISGCSVLDSTADEGAIYTKGTTSAVVTGNLVRFTASPASTEVQRGIIVTSPNVLISNNSFINCGRGISTRASKLNVISNIFETCLRAISSGLTADAEQIDIKANIFDSCQLVYNDDSGSFQTEVLSFLSNTFRLSDNTKISTFDSLNIKNINFIGNNFIGTNSHSVDRVIGYQPPSNASEISLTFINNVAQNITHATSTTNLVYFSGDCSGSNVTIQGNQVNKANIGFRVRDELFNNLVVRNNIGYNLTSSLVNSNAGTLANNILDLTGNLQ